ncbi:MAG TPA: S41 family peptidase [Limnochordales bacterium]
MIPLYKRHLRFAFAVVLVFSLAAGVLLAQQRTDETGPGERASLGTVLEVISLLSSYHWEDVDTLTLVRNYLRTGTIDGMLRESLEDDYTRYMSPQAFARFQEDTIRAEFGGVGIMVGIRDERLTIISPIAGTPGMRAGLRGGDRILRIDGQPTEHMSLEEAVSLMRGPEGERVVLTIQRGEEIFDVEIIRDRIQSVGVQRWDVITPEQMPALSAPVGYIYVSNFNQVTARQFDAAAKKLVEAGVRGLVLDLRHNPGGLLSSALELADRFLDDGPIVHVVSSNGERRTYTASPGTAFPSMPIVVLVDGNSASAAEIVAGALRDRGVAVLVGETSFGKGSVQTVVALRDGSGLTLTTAHYETAGGHFIHEKGVEPHIVVPLPEEERQQFYLRFDREQLDLDDPQLRRALEVLGELMAAGSRRAA